MLLLSVAANKPAHERHSANLIKRGQHEVMSADRAAVALVLLRRKNEEEIQVNCVLFLIKILCRAALSSAECSGQIPISEETGEFSVHGRVPSAVSVWSWVGCIVEWGGEIVSRFGPIVTGIVMMTQVQAKAML